MSGCPPAPSAVVVLDEKVASVVGVEDGTEKSTGVASTSEAATEIDSQRCLDEIGEQLMYAQRMGRQWRRRFKRPLLATGAGLCPSGVALISIFLVGGVKACFPPGIILLSLGTASLLLAVLPTDRVAIKWIARAWLAFGPILVLQELFRMLRHAVVECCDYMGTPIPRRLAYVYMLLSCVAMCSWTCIFCWFARRMRGSSAGVLESIWKSSGAICFVLLAYLVPNISLVWPYTAGAVQVWEAVLALAPYFLLGLLCWCHGPRRRLQSYLARRAGQAAPVVRIAELLGQKPIPETLESARATFRCVPGDRVTRDGLGHHSRDARLLSSTAQAHFGCVDAFVSHSWCDDPDEKWAALQEWRAHFQRRHNREPLLWVDRYCIDPQDLDEGLRCLPLYVVGCNTFLALCGPTYLERAWCLLEVFVFLAMGGSPDRVDVQLFGPCAEDFTKRIESFDAAQAKCTLETDTARLQDVFTVGFSGAGSLTHAVQALLREATLN